MRGPLAAGLQRTISAVCLAANLAGCTGWHDRATLTPAPIAARPQFIRLTLQNGHRLELHEARIVGDSILGESGFRPNRLRTAVAVHDVKKLADRQFSGGKTAGAVAGILGVFAIVGMIAVGSSVHTGLGCLCGGGK
jgi:hypothetical protein